MHLMDTMIKYGSRPVPLRTMVLRRLLSRWPVGCYEARLLAGAVMRPQQVYLCHRLNHPDYNKCKYAPGERDQLRLRNGV
jgi:hypothetical protein